MAIACLLRNQYRLCNKHGSKMIPTSELKLFLTFGERNIMRFPTAINKKSKAWFAFCSLLT